MLWIPCLPPFAGSRGCVRLSIPGKIDVAEKYMHTYTSDNRSPRLWWVRFISAAMSLLSPAGGQGGSLLGGGSSGGSLLGGGGAAAGSGSLLGGSSSATGGGSLLGGGSTSAAGSLLGGGAAAASAAPATSSALGTAAAAQQPAAAPAPAPVVEPIDYTKYSLDDIFSHKLLQAVTAFRQEPTVARRNALEASISASKHRLRDPQWLPPIDKEARTAVESRSSISQQMVSAALYLSELARINEFVAYLLVQHASRPDCEVPQSSKLRQLCPQLPINRTL